MQLMGGGRCYAMFACLSASKQAQRGTVHVRTRLRATS